MFLLFNMLSRFVVAFLPRSKPLLISWLQSPSEVILELTKRKSVTVSTSLPIYLPWSNGTKCHDLSFLNVEFKPTFSLSSFIKRLFSSSLLSAISVVSSVNLNSPSQNTGVDSFSFLQGVFPTWYQTQVSCIAGGLFTSWATREAPFWNRQH